MLIIVYEAITWKIDLLFLKALWASKTYKHTQKKIREHIHNNKHVKKGTYT